MVEIVANSIATRELDVGAIYGGLTTGSLDIFDGVSPTVKLTVNPNGGVGGVLLTNNQFASLGSTAGDSVGLISNGTLALAVPMQNYGLELKEASDNTPSVIFLSGTIFISGGALWYKGFTGTYTQLAAS